MQPAGVEGREHLEAAVRVWRDPGEPAHELARFPRSEVEARDRRRAGEEVVRIARGPGRRRAYGDNDDAVRAGGGSVLQLGAHLVALDPQGPETQLRSVGGVGVAEHEAVERVNED